MTHFINKAKGILVAGTLALTFGLVGPAQAITIDFSSGTLGAPVTYGVASYTEDHLTVTDLNGWGGSTPHVHIDTVAAPHGSVLRSHAGCCGSTPYSLAFDVVINLLSFDYMASGQTSSFLTDAPLATLAGLVDTPGGNWFTVDVATMTSNPSDFLGITLITWFQNSGSLMIDNLVYDKANDVAPIPEPSTMLLLGSGLAGIVGWRYRKQQA